MTRGPAALERLREAVARGEETLSFSEIYRDPEVKQALRQAQQEKCCFCEARIGGEGDIEHFRPKAAVRQSETEPLEKPGYWWLAYTWSNLLLCCTHCNQREKKNLFPLTDSTRRVKTPDAPLTDEEPLFIDPASIDPSEHLTFDRDEPRGLTEKGQRTIVALGLDDPERGMYLRRQERWQRIQECQEKLQRRGELESTPAGRAVVLLLERWLHDWQQPSAEFSAMACCALRSSALS
ncbi:hypothetical protein [Armatimonas rosea]|uniref:Uncharacterized protein (TIGR02646 family) n=1 Tax=Armatimonas rosea TaxID=685828 RepID=A0A7W9SM37_ARMRO|nr:hypothetical protein [Armatimonas rosea]MBB6048358.1 uncharacterized protein (TIGR02646 family) [Armatimonas rosea]